MHRYMALDIGDRRIGIAVSDPLGILASPRGIVIRDSDDSAIVEIEKLVIKYDVTRLIIGLPYSLDGSIGPQAKRVLQFKDIITKKLDIEVVMQDERLSSVTADNRLREAGHGRRRIKSEIDAAAATVILQSYLDETCHGQG